MSQNDFTIANQSFPAFRADLNSALQALASNNSGTSAPSTTFANMWWYDSTNNIMYIRNEDNDAWIKFAELDQTNDKFVLSGTLQLDDGTVSAPALTFNSDTNMGIYRGGTDILKFVTAGTDAITINASQNIGIGTSSPTVLLDLESTSPTIKLTDSDASGTPECEISGAGGDLIFRADKDNEKASSLISFEVDGSERMRIDSSGNVGISTSNPLSILDIAVEASDTRRFLVNYDDNIITAKGSNQNSNPESLRIVADNFRVSTGTTGSGSERMRIDSSGNVGIGTASPDTNLDVEGAGDCTISITANSTSHDSKIDFVQGSSIEGGITYDHNGAYASEKMFFRAGNNGTHMVLTGDGNLLVGTTSSTGFKMDLNTNGGSGLFTQSIGSGLNAILTRPSGNHSYNAMRFDNVSATIVGTISVGTSSTSYNTTSDYRLKENVVEMTDATTRLKQLQPKRFNFIADADTTVDGFLAHEVQSVVPEAITGTHNEVDDDGNPVYQGIDQSKIVPLLVKTIQELEARIVALETA
jgi:hypothetical protein